MHAGKGQKTLSAWFKSENLGQSITWPHSLAYPQWPHSLIYRSQLWKILYLSPRGFVKGFSELNSWGYPGPRVRISSIFFLPWPSRQWRIFLTGPFKVDLAKQIAIIWHLKNLTFYTFIWFWCEDTHWQHKSQIWGFSVGWEAHTGWLC